MDIIELIKQGKSAKEVSAISGKSIAKIYQIAKANDLRFTHEKPWAERDCKIIEYRQHGYSYRQISKLLGVDRGNLVATCRRLHLQGKDINPNTQEEQQRAQIETVAATCQRYRFKYLSGYQNSKSIITVQCVCCGAVKEITYSGITCGRAVCINCKAVALQQERERQKELKQQRRQQQIAERQEHKQAMRYERFTDGNPEQVEMRTCIECGALMIGRDKYCSKRCAKHASDRTQSHVRRIRIASRRHDTDITLLSVFEKDNGICYLCGGRCDWNDYKMDGDTFIAGNLYPSIDHVLAIASGGTHEWNNVRLAHRWCNSAKSNT